MTREEFKQGIKDIEMSKQDIYDTKIAEHLVHSGEYIKSLESKLTIAREFIQKVIDNENEDWADTDYIKSTLEAIQ